MIQYKLAVLVYKCLNEMAPSYLADEFLQPADFTTRTRLRSASSFCSFAVHGCRLSATERFRSPLPVSGTICRVMSPSLSVYCIAAWRVTFSSSPSRDFYSCSACAVTLSFQTLSSFLFVCLYEINSDDDVLGRAKKLDSYCTDSLLGSVVPLFFFVCCDAKKQGW